MKATDCKKFDECSAPICPLDQESLEKCSWFSDEDICTRTPYPLWIKQQKKIKKISSNPDRYFTYEMLNKNFMVKTGIEGLDPDKVESPQLKQWLKAHRGRKELTQVEKDRKRELIKEARTKRKQISLKVMG